MVVSARFLHAALARLRFGLVGDDRRCHQQFLRGARSNRAPVTSKLLLVSVYGARHLFFRRDILNG